MTHQEKVQWIAENELLCKACKYEAEGCSGEVKGGPNGPIFPPCCDGDYDHYLDYDLTEEIFEKYWEED